MVGWSDLPADLSDTAALARLSALLPGGANVVSSDLSRAIETAHAIQDTRHRLPHDPALREIHFGAWELRTMAEVQDRDHIRAFWETPGDIRAPGGESWTGFCDRVNPAIDALITAHPGNDLVVVAHFGVIVSQIQRALDLPPRAAFSHKIDNLSVTRITRTPDGWTLDRINHLP
jgi:broad specificity phosphatase PhoE